MIGIRNLVLWELDLKINMEVIATSLWLLGKL